MNSKKILIFYLITLTRFTLTTFFYVPRPKLNKFSTYIDNNEQIGLKVVHTKRDKLSNRIRRRIRVGNSYLMLIGDEIALKITDIAFWNKKDFNLSYYEKYLPDLIFDTDEVKVVNKNNYGIKKTTTGEKYQACFFNFNGPSFLYKFDIEKLCIDMMILAIGFG